MLIEKTTYRMFCYPKSSKRFSPWHITFISFIKMISIGLGTIVVYQNPPHFICDRNDALLHLIEKMSQPTCSHLFHWFFPIKMMAFLCLQFWDSSSKNSIFINGVFSPNRFHCNQSTFPHLLLQLSYQIIG